MDRFGEGLNNMCNFVLMLVYLQLLWFLFTLAGAVVLGIGPSTYAMFAVLRKWIRGDKDIPIFKTFLKVYRTDFKEANFIAISYMAAGIILYIDLLYIESQALRGFLLVIGFLYLISLLFIFPMLVHFEMDKVRDKLKYSLIIGISYLQYSLVLIIMLGVVYFLLFMIPGILTFIGISIGAYLIMWMTHQVFKKIELQTNYVQKEEKVT